MTDAERRLALMADDSDTPGDESGPQFTGCDETPAVDPEPTHAELHARLRQSIELAKQARRIAELEATVAGHRHALNRLLSALIVAGIWPKSMAGVDISTDPLTPL